MPVRPLTDSEYKLAAGLPVTHWLLLFGASQGFLTHLRFNGLTVASKNLMPTPFAKVTLPLFMLAGAAAGGFAGFQFYGDAQFRRLRFSHQYDRELRTSAQSYIRKDLL
mmetsp:Transcript_1591/g.2343  ORF Transcript_1591/g.2343 Transcript_1591/m.2343 type:complete len:109 (-) Transcript_1591:165-491(-)